MAANAVSANTPANSEYANVSLPARGTTDSVSQLVAELAKQRVDLKHDELIQESLKPLQTAMDALLSKPALQRQKLSLERTLND